MKKIPTVAPVLAVLLAAFAASSANAQQTTAAIAGVVAAGTPIELIKEGFNGTEGPVALPDGNLVFTETQGNRITRIAPDGSISTFLENSNGSNGLAISPDGEVYAVQVKDPQVGIVYPASSARVLAVRYEGAAFGRPNDIVLDRKGGVYFTDSGVNPPAPGAPPAPQPAEKPAKPAVYYISNEGALTRLAADIERPNGIQLSPDEKTLYVANTFGENVLAYDILGEGKVGQRRNFARLEGYRKTETGGTSGADGLAVDAEGRVYVATTVGIEVFTNKGEALGIIALPKAPQNIAFAGPGKKTLYAVGRGAAYKIATLAQGYTGRAK